MSTHGKIAPYIENAAESMAVCLLTMVKGNLLLVSLGHWLIAAQTGVIAGMITATTILVAHIRRTWAVSALLGVVTMFVDFFVHSGEFVPVLVEAVVTGAGAMVISYVVGHLIRGVRHVRLTFGD